MRRTRTIVLAAFAGIVLVASVIVLAYPKFKKIEKRGPAPASVTAILPVDVTAAEALVGAVFNNWSDFDRQGRAGAFRNKFPAGNQWSHFFLFRRDTPGTVFPPDDEILLDRGNDSFVERYTRIPAEERSRDFYLYEPTGDYYWPSEYFYKGQPAPFRCAFLIHLEPAGERSAVPGSVSLPIGGPAMTTFEIFEYQPIIWVGEYLGLTAHSIGPAMLHDIRPVEETTADRQAVVAMLQTAAKTSAR